MATEKHGIEADIEVGGEKYSVLWLRIEERLDEVPRLRARMTRDDALPKPAALLGAEAKARVGATELFDAPRTFAGLVTEAVRRIDVGGRPFVELTVEPVLFKLAKRTNMRTFLEQKVDEIVKKVLDEARVPHSFQLGESYVARPNTIQYRETDLDFVRRICSEEGIAMAWDHEAGEAIFFDDPRGLTDADDKTMKYVPEFGFDQVFACVQKVSRAQKVVTDKVHLRQYDFEKPRTLVEAKLESKDDGGHALEAYVYPARTVDSGAAERWGQTLLDSIQRNRDTVVGTSSSWTLGAAERFTLEAHPQEAMNQELLVVGVELEHGDERTAVGRTRMATRLSFEAVPVERCPYRPARRGRQATVPGVQLATTTGASGQEIDCDEHGRVTAIFPWDRGAKADETASVRMRTIQLPTGGSMLLPRVGWEVLVQHDEGDVDVPLVIGRLYNGIKQPPYALPGGAVRSALQTATTPGGGSVNELRTDDSKGKEEIFFNASKDMTTLVKNNTTTSVANNATLKVGGDQSTEITNSLTTSIGANQTIDVGGNQKTAVETSQVDEAGGDVSITIGGNRDMKVGGDHRHTVGGSETIEVGGMKTDLVVGKISEDVGGDAKVDIGAAAVTLTPADINLEIGGNHDETVGAVKIVLAFGGVGSDASGTSMKQIGGGKIDLVDGDRAETAGATYTSLAAGAQIVKADNIVFEAEGMITLVMGASILSVTPASVSILGASVKLDGATAETSALVLDN